MRAAWVGRATDFYTYARVHAGLVSTLPHFNPPIIRCSVVSAPERAHPSASRNGSPPRVPHVSHDASTRTPNESKFSFFFNSFVPVHRVTGYHSPTPTSRCVRCVVLASSPSRRRPRSDIPMRVVASRVARRASRTKQKTKNKNKNKTYLGGSLGDERRGGDGASGGGRNGERHRRTCASSVVTSAARGPAPQWKVDFRSSGCHISRIITRQCKKT